MESGFCFLFFSFPSYNTNTIFFFKLFHRWPFQALSSWLLRPFDMIHPFFFFLMHFLSFWHHKCPRHTLDFPWPRTEIRHFSKETWFFCWKMTSGNQDLGAGHGCCYWSFTGFMPSLRIEQGNIYMYTNHIDTHFYNYFCIYLSV